MVFEDNIEPLGHNIGLGRTEVRKWRNILSLIDISELATNNGRSTDHLHLASLKSSVGLHNMTDKGSLGK